MRKSLILVPLVVCLLGLVACGGGSDEATGAGESAAAPATTAASASETPAPDSKYTQKQLDAVKKLQDKYLAKYQGVFDDLAAAGFMEMGEGGTETESIEDVEGTIESACDHKANPQSEDEKSQGMAMLGMMMGETLQKHGTDLVEMMADATKFDKQVTEIVGC